MWQEIIATIQQHQDFVLTSHINPDCDALGSELALAEHLLDLGKRVKIINSDPLPEAYTFLDPHNLIRKYWPPKHDPLITNTGVIIVLDASGGWSRTGRHGQTLELAPARKICIDHHPDSVDFVDVAVIDTGAAATAELIYDLIRAMQGSLSPSMAQALYAAILTDTGSFRYPKTSAHTHRITADLLTAGVNPLYVYHQIYEQNSLNRVRLKGHVADSIETAAEGQIAYYSLDRQTLKEYNVEVSELDGFAGLGQEIEGVRVTIFGVQSSKSKVKISLRSDGSCPINQIAAAYDGGGHPSAAGATIAGNLAEIMAEILARAKRLLETTSAAGEEPP